jgi:hypothetical protein
MRRERAALQPDLGKLALKTLQSRCEHPRVRVNYAPPDDLAGLSTTHIAVRSPPTSNPANMVIAAHVFRNREENEGWAVSIQGQTANSAEPNIRLIRG